MQGQTEGGGVKMIHDLGRISCIINISIPFRQVSHLDSISFMSILLIICNYLIYLHVNYLLFRLPLQ